MEVRYANHAIANNFGSYIELNENLKKYPELHAKILRHELGHTQQAGFTKQDLVHDLSDNTASSWELLKFMCKHPRAFLQLAPFYKQGSTIFYDINMILAWSFGLGLVGIAVWLALL